MELKFLILYPDLMNLNSDISNIKILKYRAEKRRIKVLVDEYQDEISNIDFKQYDLIFLGNGSDINQKIVLEKLQKQKPKIVESLEKGTFYFLIGGGSYIFGKYYYDTLEEKVNALSIFDYYTEKKDFSYGNVNLKVNLSGKNVNVVGFENSKNVIVNTNNYFGKIIGCSNKKVINKYDGFFIENVLCTNLNGPLFSKNPELADYIIKLLLDRKYKCNIKLKNIDDKLEIIAKNNIINNIKKVNV